MADLAVGVSKKVVDRLMKKVDDAIKEEKELRQIVRRDFVFIKDEFEMMQSFLNTVDRTRVKNNAVGTWVKQVRELSYDAEDCIDNVLHLDTERPWWWAFWPRLLPTCCRFGVGKALDEAVDEIKLLKVRVEEVSKRNQRYNLAASTGSLEMQQTAAASTRNMDPAMVKEGSCNLNRLLTRDKAPDLQVVSVWGTGGDLGTISIIRSLYQNTLFYQDFTCRAWVKLMHPLSFESFIRELVAMTRKKYHTGKEGAPRFVEVEATEAPIDQLVLELQTNLKDSYLVILEDLSSMAQWDTISRCLPNNKNGSRIIVSTHQPEIASLCTGVPHGLAELVKLSEFHSVCAFYKEGSTIQVAPVSYIPSFIVQRTEECYQLSRMISLSGHKGTTYVVTVLGLPGVGKTTLVTLAYSRFIDEPVFELHGWVNVFSPLDVVDFSHSLLSQLRKQQVEEPAAGSFISDCQHLLRNHRCLVVIDGLKSVEDCRKLLNAGLIDGHPNSCVVVVTTEQSVATYWEAELAYHGVFHVKPLDNNPSMLLFERLLFGSRPQSISYQQHLDVIGILDRCGGLPKVILSVADYLSSSGSQTWGQRVAALNDNFIHELATNPVFHGLEGLLTWIDSYFQACTPSLKFYVLYMFIFPKRSIIQRRRLMRRWIAEGYINDTDIYDMMIYAEERFQELANLSMMQVLKELPRAHDINNSFFRELLFSRAEKDKVSIPLEVAALTEGECRLPREFVGELHLGIHKEWPRNPLVFNSLDLSRLRSLTVCGDWMSFFINDKMRALRVLDLEGVSSGIKNDDLEKIPKLLRRLRFLSLRRCSGIDRLPDSIGDLRHLQTLDIRGTKITTLQTKSIIKLRNLQHLLAGDSDTTVDRMDGEAYTPWWRWSRLRTLASSCSSCEFRRDGHLACHGVSVPRGMLRKLTALRTLGVVNVNTAGGVAILEDLRHLGQLSKLALSGINSYNQLGLDHIKNLPRLKSLSLVFAKEDEERDKSNNIPCFPSSLQRLKLWGRLLTEEEMQKIVKLNALRTLRLHFNTCQEGKLAFLGVDPDARQEWQWRFQELKVLEISSRGTRLGVSFAPGVVNNLEVLKVGGSLDIDPCRLLDMGFLKEVWISGYELYTALKRVLENHPNQPAVLSWELDLGGARVD